MERKGGGGSGGGGGGTRETVSVPEWPEWLPKTWEIEARKRKDGRVDKFFTEPEHHYVFRSKIDALRYMEFGEVRNRNHKRKRPGSIRLSPGNDPLLPSESLTSRCEEEHQHSPEGSHMPASGGETPGHHKESSKKTKTKVTTDLPNRSSRRLAGIAVDPSVEILSERSLLKKAKSGAAAKSIDCYRSPHVVCIDNSADSKSMSMTAPLPSKVHKLPLSAMEPSENGKSVARKLPFENVASGCEKMHQHSVGPSSESFHIPNSGDAGRNSSAHSPNICLGKAQVEQDHKTGENQALASHESRELTIEAKPKQIDRDHWPMESEARDHWPMESEARELKQEEDYLMESAGSILNDPTTINAAKRKSWNDVPIRISRNKQARMNSSTKTDFGSHAPSSTFPSEPVSSQHRLRIEGLCKQQFKPDEKPVVKLEESQVSRSGVDLQHIMRDEPVGAAQVNLLSDRACRLEEEAEEGALPWQKFNDTKIELPDTPAPKAGIAKRIGDRLFDPCIEFACKILTGDESVLEDAITMQKLFDDVLWTSKDLHSSPPPFAHNVQPVTPIQLDNVGWFNTDRTIESGLQCSDKNKRLKRSKN